MDEAPILKTTETLERSKEREPSDQLYQEVTETTDEVKKKTMQEKA